MKQQEVPKNYGRNRKDTFIEDLIKITSITVTCFFKHIHFQMREYSAPALFKVINE